MITLRTRVLNSPTASATATLTNFKDTPILVTRNLLRSMINFSFSKSFASSMGVKPVICRSIDTRSKNPIPFTLIERLDLWHMLDNKTGNLIGMMPFVPNMPLLIKENIATELGIFNGTRCTFSRLVLHPDEPQFDLEAHSVEKTQHWLQRMPLYIVVNIPKSQNGEWKFKQFPGLALGEFPIFPRQESIPHFLNGSKQKQFFRRSQFPVLPGYAMTGYAAQGQTFTEGAIVDLSTPPLKRGKSDPADSYVLLSRLRSLIGLLILRPFLKSDLCTTPSSYIFAEIRRLAKFTIRHSQSSNSSTSVSSGSTSSNLSTDSFETRRKRARESSSTSTDHFESDCLNSTRSVTTTSAATNPLPSSDLTPESFQARFNRRKVDVSQKN